MYDKRINIFTGHFGSGKTEVAVNFALKLNELKGKTAIVDMDIVNPFFRTADAKNELESHGIRVILPLYANTNVEAPAVPAEANSIIEDRNVNVVLDVGGDDLGARALARYREEITEDSFEMFFVVNIRRPMTDTEFKIEQMMYEIESSSKMKITGIVNNTNLLQYSTGKELLEGEELIQKIANKYGLKILFTSGTEDALEYYIKAKVNEGFDKKQDLLVLNRLIKLPWD